MKEKKLNKINIALFAALVLSLALNLFFLIETNGKGKTGGIEGTYCSVPASAPGEDGGYLVFEKDGETFGRYKQYGQLERGKYYSVDDGVYKVDGLQTGIYVSVKDKDSVSVFENDVYARYEKIDDIPIYINVEVENDD